MKLDERHASEQDALGQPRFEPGRYVVELVKCSATAGDPAIWEGEKHEVLYYVVAAMIIEAYGEDGDPRPELIGVVAHWVNRLRFRGPHQLKEFLVEASGIWATEHHRITEDVVEFSVSDENPLEGVKLRLNVLPPKSSGYLHYEWKRV